jgi:hypothetical protein
MRALALLSCLCLGACTWFKGDRHVLVTSEPPGARILVDGKDTGRTTPCLIALGGMLDVDHSITVEKKGYQPAGRYISSYTEGYTSLFIDGVAEIGLPPFPLFWTIGDTLTPFAVRWDHVPHDIYVKLYKVGEPAPCMVPPPRASTDAPFGIAGTR